MLLLLLACAPPDAEDPWSECGGYAARDDADRSRLFLIERSGQATVVAVSDWGVRWDVLTGMDTLTADGAAPFAWSTLDTVVVAPGTAGVTLLAYSIVREVGGGFSSPEHLQWWVDDDVEHGFVSVRNGWVVGQQVFVTTAEGGSGRTVSAGLATADADGRLVPITDALLTEQMDGTDLRLDGAWDPRSERFLLTSTRAPGRLWRVSRDGEVEEDTLADDLPSVAAWVPLGDGRWTGLSADALVVFDPELPGSLVAVDRSTLDEPFRSGVIQALDGGAVALSHVDGVLTIQAWDGEDPATGARLETDYTVSGCDWFANMPPLTLAR